MNQKNQRRCSACGEHHQEVVKANCRCGKLLEAGCPEQPVVCDDCAPKMIFTDDNPYL